MTELSPAARDGRGRFTPGCSGNPAGKRPGTRNRATRLKALLRDGDAAAAGRAIIARAVGGDAVAGRFLFERLDPKPRGRPIVLPRASGTLAERFAAVFAAVANGDMTPDEALALGRLLDLERKAVDAAAGRRDDAASSPEPTAAQRQDALLAELAAVFGPDAVAPRADPPPEAPPEAPEPRAPLHSTCIAALPASPTDADAGTAPDAAPAPPPVAPRIATTRRGAYWRGSARVRRRRGNTGKTAPPVARPSPGDERGDARYVRRDGDATPP